MNPADEFKRRGEEFAARAAAARGELGNQPGGKKVESSNDWGEGQKDWFSQESKKMADLKEVKGFYFDTRVGEYEGKPRKSHLFLMPKNTIQDRTEMVHVRGAADLDRFLEGKPKGMTVRVKFLEKKLDAKGAPHNYFDFSTYPDRKLDQTWYPDAKIQA